MSQKLEIQWDNSNPVFESVRIYKSATAFTANNLPALLTEITDIGVSSYDDLDVELNETWFYMLSTKLAVAEAFTECFEVLIVDDVKNTLAIQPAFFVPSLWVSGWNPDSGDFKVWKSGITDTVSSSANSMKIYAAPYRKVSDGSFYYELVCTKVVNNAGSTITTYPVDNMFGLMQNGATVNINSNGSNFNNEGYGRYILRNNQPNIQGAGGNLTTLSSWTSKVSGKQFQINDVIGIGIRASGSNTLIEIWINGVYQGVMFTIAGTSIELRPLIIFTLENNYVKATHYKYPRTLSYLPEGYQSWLTAI